MITQKLKIKGMHCTSCAKNIEQAIKEINGIKAVKVSYEKETAEIIFDNKKTNIDEIKKAIEKLGYSTENKSSRLGIFLGLLGIFVLGYFIFYLSDYITLPEISQNMGYGLLFLLGLLTGFHCVSMCGGFVLSYTTKNAKEGIKSYKSHLMYAIGKTTSYTLIGAAFGLFGSIIVFTPTIRGIAGLISGLFLIIFGLNMLDLFSWLKKIRINIPSLSKFAEKKSSNKSPLVIGLLNGLMIACGPLQAIYIMAAGTGSLVEGAKLLFIFALGTLPVMLSFGYITSFISFKTTHKILKASGIIVIILGLIMVNRGLALTGTGYDFNTILSSETISTTTENNININSEGYQEIKMDVLFSGFSPDKFVLKKRVPVKWIINGKELSNCNNAIQVPKLGLNFNIKPGIQTIEFTPTEEGVIPWSCWMGMLYGTFIVKSDIDLEDKASVQKELNAIQVPKSGGCGCGRN